MEEEEPIYYKIFKEYFSADMHDSPDLMKKAFHEVLKYLEKLNKILMTGSQEEKAQALHEYQELRKMIEEQVARFKEQKKMNDQDFQNMLHDPKNYKKEDWEVIQESVGELKNIPDLQQNISQHTPPDKHPKKRSKKSNNKWLKS